MWHSLKLATCILIFCHAAIVQTDSGPLVRYESQTSGWLAKSFPLVHIVQIETYDCVCLLMISSYIGAINIIVVV